MISIRKFLAAKQEIDDSAELRRIVRLLVQGIGLHAVEGDPQDYRQFRYEVREHLEAAETPRTTADLLKSTGAILKTLEAYNSRTTRYLRMQGAELQHMIAMLARTVTTLGSGSLQSVERLREIEHKLAKTSGIEDVRALKQKLEECLECIRTESVRQKTEGARTIETLKEAIRKTKQRISSSGAGSALDPTTGLPSRDSAVAALAEWVLQDKPPCAGLFVLDRVALINSRFGYKIGDQVLKAYLEELQRHLAPVDRVFRWSGPAFLVVLMRPERIEKVREQLRYTLPGRLERNFELPNRSAMLSITATWTVLPMNVPVEELVQQLDSFVATQNPTATG